MSKTEKFEMESALINRTARDYLRTGKQVPVLDVLESTLENNHIDPEVFGRLGLKGLTHLAEILERLDKKVEEFETVDQQG